MAELTNEQRAAVTVGSLVRFRKGKLWWTITRVTVANDVLIVASGRLRGVTKRRQDISAIKETS